MSESGICGVQPSGINVACLLDEGHEGPHRWWDESSIIRWVPYSEPWRKEPSGDYMLLEKP